MSLDQFTVYTIVVPVVMGLAELLKISFAQSKKTTRTLVNSLVPLFCVIMSIVLSVALYGLSAAVAVNGIVTGLASIGLYSGGKTTKNAIKK